MPDENYHTVIIGSGPNGLISALVAAKYSGPDEKIAIVGDRFEERGVRQQVLWLNEDIGQFVKELVTEKHFENFVSQGKIRDGHPGFYVKTGDLENLLHQAAIDERISSKKIEWVEAKKTPRNESSMTLGPESITITTPNKEKRTLAFQNIIDTTGVKRDLIKEINKMPPNNPIKFEKLDTPLPHTKHLVVTFNIPKNSNAEEFSKLLNQNEGHPESLEKLKSEYGWPYPTRPFSKVRVVDNVAYIGVEIPETLNDKEAQWKYAKTLLKDHLPDEAIKDITPITSNGTSYGDKQEQLSISSFDIELGKISKTYVQLPTGRTAFFQGDSSINPLYTTDSGLQTGILQALALAKHFQTISQIPKDASVDEKSKIKNSSLAVFERTNSKILDDIVRLQKDWIATRKDNLNSAEKNHKLLEEIKNIIAEIDKFAMTANSQKAQQISERLKSALPKDIKDYSNLDLTKIIQVVKNEIARLDSRDFLGKHREKALPKEHPRDFLDKHREKALPKEHHRDFLGKHREKALPKEHPRDFLGKHREKAFLQDHLTNLLHTAGVGRDSTVTNIENQKNLKQRLQTAIHSLSTEAKKLRETLDTTPSPKL